MSKIGEVLLSLEGNQQQLEKFETLVYQDKQRFIKLPSICTRSPG